MELQAIDHFCAKISILHFLICPRQDVSYNCNKEEFQFYFTAIPYQTLILNSHIIFYDLVSGVKFVVHI
jgi:hypothetical protein